MKRIILLSFLFACKHHDTPEEIKAKAEQRAKEIAAPYIAEELGNLNIEVAYIKNTNLSFEERNLYIKKIKNDFPEYMTNTTELEYYTGEKINFAKTTFEQIYKIEARMPDSSISSKKFQQAVDLQSDYIRKKWFLYGAQQVYKESFDNIWGDTTQPCNVASGLSGINITESSATLDWYTVPEAISYNVRYRKTGTTTWTNTTATASAKAVSGLTASTSYEFQVQTVCSGGSSSFSSSATFTTSGSSSNCAVAQGLSGINILLRQEQSQQELDRIKSK